VISHVLAMPTAWSLMLGALALVAAASIVGRPADARAGVRATSVTRASPTLTVRSTRFGRILFDGRGRALYAFTRDPRGGRSRCYSADAKAWPIYLARGRLRAGKGVRQCRTELQALGGSGRRRSLFKRRIRDGDPSGRTHGVPVVGHPDAPTVLHLEICPLCEWSRLRAIDTCDDCPCIVCLAAQMVSSAPR
jgi:predicted lipoprotein with Yx(FWY)xxD motif